jgi:transposase
MSQDERMVKLRLSWFRHVKEITGNVAKTCRHYGISQTMYYRWYDRYLEQGLEDLKDCSKKPKSNPRATKREVVEKILYLKQHYHFGPTKIHMYLDRYIDTMIFKSALLVSGRY